MRIEAVENGTRAGAAPIFPSSRTDSTGDFAQSLAGARSEYVVRRGDTLSQVVLNELRREGAPLSTRELYSRVRDVADANALDDPDKIFPGQRIDLSRLRAKIAEHSGDVELEPEHQTSNASIVEGTAGRAMLPAGLHGFVGSNSSNGEHEKELLDSRLRNDNGVATGSDRSDRANESEVREVEAKSIAAPEAIQTDLLRNNPDAAFTSFLDSLPPSPWRAVLDGPARLTSEFGGRTNPIKGGHEHHDGIDLAVKLGTRVFPIASGRVVETGWRGGLGNVVVVRHDDGTESIYGHNSRVLVSPGEKVSRDTALALSGSTGFATGPHLHLEVHRGGKAVDPVPLLTTARVQSGA